MPDRPTAASRPRQDRVALILELIDRALAECEHPTTTAQVACAG
jgi:hypothetical protein